MGVIRKEEPKEALASRTPGPHRKRDDESVPVARLLINTMAARKEMILASVVRSIRESSEFIQTYKEFLTDSQEGRRRLGIVYEQLLKALRGDVQSLVDDQFRTGYLRATQGVPLEETLKVHRMFERCIIDEFLTMYLDMELSYRDLQEEIKTLGFVVDKARETVSKSYLKTREEIIEKRTAQIEGLYKLRIALSDNVTLRKLSKVLVRDICEVLGASYAILTIYRPGSQRSRFLRLGNSQEALEMFERDKVDGILAEMWEVRTPHLIDRTNKVLYPIKPEGLDTVPSGYWLMIPIFTAQNFYGFLSISTLRLNDRIIGADSYVILSVVSKIAEAMEKERTMRTLRKSQFETRRLAGRIIAAQEEERRKISAEVHDTIIQRLTGIWYKLLYIEEKAPCFRNEHPEDLAFLKRHVNESIREARRIVYGLRPLMLDQLGLQKTVQEHAKAFEKEFAIGVDVSVRGDVESLPPEKKISVFRILQEALENVRKHSDTDRVRIRLTATDKACTFRVEDYGTARPAGLSLQPESTKSHFGLMIMSERSRSMGGTLRYGFKKQGGFMIQGSFPCH